MLRARAEEEVLRMRMLNTILRRLLMIARRGGPAALALAPALALVCGVGGCGGEIRVDDGDVPRITFETFRDAHRESLEEPGAIVIVDPRISYRYEAGHIEGAINIPLSESQPGDRRLADARRIIVYGEDTESARALAMSKKLLTHGYKRVEFYVGGVEEWRRRDQPLVTGG